MKMHEFDIFDWGSLRGFHGKVFLFEKCIIYTETLSSKLLQFRGFFEINTMNIEYEQGRSRLKLSKVKNVLTEVKFTSDNDTAYQWNQLISCLMAHETEIKTIDREFLL